MEEQRQIIGNRKDVYKRYYILNFIIYNILVIYLGTILYNNLIKSIGYFEHYKKTLDRLINTQKHEI